MDELDNQYNFIFYQGNDGVTKIQVFLDRETETIWVTQKAMGEIFDVAVQNITIHLQNIYADKELSEKATCKEFLQVQKEGNRQVSRIRKFYNLDAIISVGYRVNSPQATRFRIWATQVLKEYMIKGFVLDDERLKQGKNAFGKDYFDELLERIREIRASERHFYQKVTDLYATAIDYDKNATITQLFFKTVQNKLEYAITKNTAAEIIKMRADSNKPNMGLTTWKNAKTGGKILKSDVSIAKNYLLENEITELNRVVNMYLDYAENLAKKGKAMTMKDWVEKLDAFLKFNEYEILNDAGRISADVAKAFAEEEYSKFRVIQDREYISDYDRFDDVAGEIKSTGKLPQSDIIIADNSENPNSSSFDKKLKKAMNYNPNKKKKSNSES